MLLAFQFTHPGKGATNTGIDLMASPTALFQFTHPGKGATICTPITAGHKSWFQFTHPGKGATLAHL